jgi:hypothetical protein
MLKRQMTALEWNWRRQVETLSLNSSADLFHGASYAVPHRFAPGSSYSFQAGKSTHDMYDSGIYSFPASPALLKLFGGENQPAVPGCTDTRWSVQRHAVTEDTDSKRDGQGETGQGPDTS